MFFEKPVSSRFQGVAKGSPCIIKKDVNTLMGRNRKLDHLLKPRRRRVVAIDEVADGEDEVGADARITKIAADLNRRPYIIHLAPGHLPLGALGYVDAARELVGQMADSDLALDEIVIASGSGHTHGGLLFGLRALGCEVPVTGVCVRRAAEPQFERISARCREIAAMLNVEPLVDDRDIHLIDNFFAAPIVNLNGDVYITANSSCPNV